MVKVLDRKVWRDLSAMKGQVLTIAMLLASAITVFVGAIGTYMSLLESRDRYYQDSRFADLWAEVERAPRSLLGPLSEISGIASVEPRVVKDVRIDWPASDLSISGRIVSIGRRSETALNKVTILRGSAIDPSKQNEVLINAAFAESWGIEPNDGIAVILNGRLQTFRVAGLAQSPEYVYGARPGSPLPDDRTFAVLWGGEEAVANAFDMEGAFNSLSFSVAPGSSLPRIVADLDRLLEPFGGRGAYDRTEQPSNRFLSDELAEQRTLALAVPVVFFAVSIFLLNAVLGRLVQAQREQIASLKALGYPSIPIGLHYLKFVGVICAAASVVGIVLGAFYTDGMLAAYRPFFRFPELAAHVPYWVPAVGIALSAAAAGSGALNSVRRVLRLRPADAMRSAVPGHTAKVIGVRLNARAKMMVRGLVGRPIRTLVTILSLALAVPMLVLGLFWWDALAYMIEVQFDRIERADAIVSLTDARPERAVYELAGIPGVLMAEGQRVVEARLRAGPRTYRLGLTGLLRDAELRLPRSEDLAPIDIPKSGILLTTELANRLGVMPGSLLAIDLLEGRRTSATIQVSGLVDEVLGYNAYMDIDELNHLMRQTGLVSQVSLKVDPRQTSSIWPELSKRPRIAGTTIKSVLLQIFDEKVRSIIIIAAVVLTTFGLIIAVGVVYNAARIGLQERAWELASLRVMGFTRREVSNILIGDLAVQAMAALPIGLLSAQGIVSLLLGLRENESFRIPAVISAGTFATSALVVIGAAVASGLLIRWRVDRLDLVAVLKTRE
ncbi:ABC transporter permease [Roseiarcaceae bacterium H3SJ34-1]|uniref:ABC transporter permease n=1 Tax=Terripilifer ovatus TaxID=3032367 RepID=UPI003AB98F73|nr:ABC transporter permease [Roseiarcaceae bacterium H3SJ34-1]